MYLTEFALVLLLSKAAVGQLHPASDQAVLNSKDDMDFLDSGYYYGISTFAHTRYVNCYSNADSKDNLYDIAILGAPHDTVSSTSHGQPAHDTTRLTSPQDNHRAPGSAIRA